MRPFLFVMHLSLHFFSSKYSVFSIIMMSMKYKNKPNSQNYEALVETIEVLSDSETMTNLKQALLDEKEGRIFTKDTSGRFRKIKKQKK